MNKQQFKAYRHSQRVCQHDEGWPVGKEEYFERIPLSRPPYQAGSGDLLLAWKQAKREYEWRRKAGRPEWDEEMVLVGHNNPHAAASIRYIIKRRYTPY